ncbi:hypothetical protein ACFPPD_20555 [Cohnella suwonensis]|uniref:Uncharacterized protein n=1 Tax=Cohnella suwonensis TaxID=696072 RepID=A0ABW0M0K8_9BACL
MRRYWLSITLGALAFLGLGGYYFRAATDRMPDYRLVTKSGDEKVAEALTLLGAYAGRREPEYVQISGEGSDYRREQSLYERSFGSRSQYLFERFVELRKLKQDHRQFMRGKTDAAGFYRDEKWVAYATTERHELGSGYSEMWLKLDLLNETSGKRTNYSVNFSESASFSYVYDVQLIDEELHALVLDEDGRGGERVLRDIVVNVSDGRVVRSDEIKLSGDAKFSHAISEEAITEPSANVVLISATGGKSGKGAIYAYDYKEGKLAEITVPGDSYNANEGQLSLHHGVLTSVFSNKDGVSFWSKPIEQASAAIQAHKLTAKELGADKIVFATPRNNRIYVMKRKLDISQIAVFDPNNGASLYEGEVVLGGDSLPVSGELSKLEFHGIRY